MNKYKVLVMNVGSNSEEFYNYDKTIGWCTGQVPTTLMNKDTTWVDINSMFNGYVFPKNVDLVTIEINISEVVAK